MKLTLKRSLSFFVFTSLVTCLVTSDANARGGRGGGGRGGGGRAGGGHAAARSGGGGYRGAMRTPSMSRPQARPANRLPTDRFPPSGSRPNISRPAPGGYRPNIHRPSTGGSRPNINRPTPGGNRPNVHRQGQGGSRPNFSSRPSASDLGGFLGLPGNHRPTTLPSRTDRPNLGNRPNVGNRPHPGSRPNLGNRPNTNVGRENRARIHHQKNVNSIRNHWAHANRRPFSKNWWGRYPTTLPGWRWHASWGRYPGSWYWRHARWPVVGTWFVWQWADPVIYNYGTNVVYRDNYVYVDDQPIATTDDYYQQAETIAGSVPEDSLPEDGDAEQIEWMPLGVYAIAEEGGTESGMLVQLAVSKEGILAGTFYIDATDEGRPLEGMVDRETQRAAWKFADGKNEDIVMETAIYNLTQDDTTALVHFGEDKTQTWLMVRLPEEEEEEEE